MIKKYIIVSNLKTLIKEEVSFNPLMDFLIQINKQIFNKYQIIKELMIKEKIIMKSLIIIKKV